jgi:hypothetical protein
MWALERTPPPDQRVARFVHRAHAALADELAQRVLGVDDVADLRDGLSGSGGLNAPRRPG